MKQQIRLILNSELIAFSSQNLFSPWVSGPMFPTSFLYSGIGLAKWGVTYSKTWEKRSFLQCLLAVMHSSTPLWSLWETSWCSLPSHLFFVCLSMSLLFAVCHRVVPPYHYAHDWVYGVLGAFLPYHVSFCYFSIWNTGEKQSRSRLENGCVSLPVYSTRTMLTIRGQSGHQIISLCS